jgi:hypothetical protein
MQVGLACLKFVDEHFPDVAGVGVGDGLLVAAACPAVAATASRGRIVPRVLPFVTSDSC